MLWKRRSYVSTDKHDCILFHTNRLERIQHHSKMIVEVRHTSPVANSEVVLLHYWLYIGGKDLVIPWVPLNSARCTRVGLLSS